MRILMKISQKLRNLQVERNFASITESEVILYTTLKALIEKAKSKKKGDKKTDTKHESNFLNEKKLKKAFKGNKKALAKATYFGKDECF